MGVFDLPTHWVYVHYEDGTVKRGRTYYYQLKAYRNYKGKKVYSEASKILSVKIK